MPKLNTEGGAGNIVSSGSGRGLSLEGSTVSAAVTKVRSGLDIIVRAETGYAPGIR